MLLFILASLFTDVSNGSLLVVDKINNSVSIIDLNTNKEVAKINTGKGPHEVAVSPNGKWAVVSNYGSTESGNSLSLIDISNKVNKNTIDLKEYKRPHGLEFINDREVLVTSEATQTLLKVNIETNEVSVVARTNQTQSHMVAYSKSDGRAYVANINAGTVSIIDVGSKTLLHQMILKPGIEGLDISPNGKELWVANRIDSSVAVVNTKTFRQEATLPAHQVAFRVKFTPDGKYVVVSNGMSGNMSVYDVGKRVLIKDVDFTLEKNNPPVPVGIAVNGNGKYMYVANGNYGLVAIVDTNTWEVVGRIETGGSPDGMYWARPN